MSVVYWDHFCPKCGSLLEAGRNDASLEKFEKDMKGKLVECSSCGIVYDFDTLDEVKEVSPEICDKIVKL